NGNITDSKSMSLCVKEMNVKDVIYIADKGFFSAQNTRELNQENPFNFFTYSFIIHLLPVKYSPK
ncbi:MAG: hypothetical protein WDZ72_02585, partial [Cyclobacteriaceae bacterium]